MKRHIRIQDPKTIDSKHILRFTEGGNDVIVQFSESVQDLKLLRKINELCDTCNRNLCVRFYGHYDTGFDCRVLRHLPNVKSLYLDCLQSATNFSELKALKHIEALNIGIYELDERDFLSWENLRAISYLGLSETRKNNIDLRHLSGYTNVETLFLNGHTKNIDSVGGMSNLSELSLCTPSRASISFVNQLPKLQKLRLILGGRANLDEVHNHRLEELEIVRVRGFSSFGNIGEFSRLKKLLIEDQIQIKEIKFQQILPALTDIRILNCKTLSRIEGIHYLSALYHLHIYKTAIEFPEFIAQEFPQSLKKVSFYTARKKVDQEIQEQLKEMGYIGGLDG